MNYKISEEAATDLGKIWLYTLENWSVEQADRYFNLLINEIQYISKDPTSGRDYKNIRKQYFCSKVKFHLIFYKINSKKDEIEIIRILHQRMDIESIINH